MRFFSLSIFFVFINSILKFALVEVIDDELYAYYQSVIGIAGFVASQGSGAFIRNIPKIIKNKQIAFYYNKITILVPILVVFLIWFYIKPSISETILLITSCVYYYMYDYLNQLYLLKNKLLQYAVIEFTVIFSIVIVYLLVFFDLNNLIYYSLIPSILFLIFTQFNFKFLQIGPLNKDFVDKYVGNFLGSSLVFLFPLIIYQFSLESNQIGLQIAEFYLFNLIATFNILLVNKILYNAFDYYKNKIVPLLLFILVLEIIFLISLKYVNLDLKIFQYIKTSNLLLSGIFYVITRTIYSSVFVFSRFLDNTISFTNSEFFRLLITALVFLLLFYFDFALLESMYLSIGSSMFIISLYYLFKFYNDKKLK